MQLFFHLLFPMMCTPVSNKVGILSVACYLSVFILEFYLYLSNSICKRFICSLAEQVISSMLVNMEVALHNSLPCQFGWIVVSSLVVLWLESCFLPNCLSDVDLCLSKCWLLERMYSKLFVLFKRPYSPRINEKKNSQKLWTT